MEKVKLVDDYLNDINYTELNSNYIPSEYALRYLAYIKLITKDNPESHLTPVMHLKMLDALIHSNGLDIINLVFRGSGKAIPLTDLVATPNGFIPMNDIVVGSEVIDRTGKVTKVIYESSIFTDKDIYKITLDDGRIINVCEDHLNIVNKITTGGKFKEQNVTVKEILQKKLFFNRKISWRNPEGKENKWYIPLQDCVEYVHKDLPIDPYTLGVILGDGSINANCYTRIHSCLADVIEIKSYIPYAQSDVKHDKRNYNAVCFGLLKMTRVIKSTLGYCNVYKKFIPHDYLYSSIEQRYELLKGLMDTDGTIDSKTGSYSFSTVSAKLCEDFALLVRSLGGRVNVQRHNGSYRLHIITLENPFKLKRKSAVWKKSTTNKLKHTAVTNIEKITKLPCKCIAVASPTESFLLNNYVVTHNTSLFCEFFLPILAIEEELPNFGKITGVLSINDTMENGAKSLRNNMESRYDKSPFLQEWLPKVKFTDPYIEFTNKRGHQLGINLFGVTSSIRGKKMFGQRPQLAILDDLISDKNAQSPTIMNDIRETVYKSLEPALDISRKKVIWNGTPFNKEDPLYQAAESGGYYVNVFPVCEKFPCSKEEFVGAWQERFSYEALMKTYKKLESVGQNGAFQQEMMLRISSPEDRLVQDKEIHWFSRVEFLKNRYNFNYYITTDFATTDKTKSDYNVISVWAYSNNGDWFWVDGICKRQTIDKTIDQLFDLVQEYKPQAVGIERSGQQNGFISWIQKEQMNKNVFFNIARQKGKLELGIYPSGDKLSRFNLVVPLFRAGKIHFPTELKDTTTLMEFMSEISLATVNGLKGKDDCLDTISMLQEMVVTKPSLNSKIIKNEISNNVYFDNSFEEEYNSINSYIVD
jgi:predicted phage terminase large subunit-like protein